MGRERVWGPRCDVRVVLVYAGGGGVARLFEERHQHREAAVCHAHVRRRHAQPSGNIGTLQLEGVGLEDVEVHRVARRSRLARGGDGALGDRREARDEGCGTVQMLMQGCSVPETSQQIQGTRSLGDWGQTRIAQLSSTLHRLQRSRVWE
eukprot:scaffold18492_cov72-Phaeocystis_antarctica.AAC.3